jgi:hypothetical protein
MGMQDVPAQIDYILDLTKEASVIYIGYGRGNQ